MARYRIIKDTEKNVFYVQKDKFLCGWTNLIWEYGNDHSPYNADDFETYEDAEKFLNEIINPPVKPPRIIILKEVNTKK